jgi:hypothetical protein
VVKGMKKITTPQHQDSFNIPVINNRYNRLPISKECEVSEAISSSAVQQKSAKKISNKKKNKVIIIGDSHARGCASEVQLNLDLTFETQGTVKPGAILQEIISPPR